MEEREKIAVKLFAQQKQARLSQDYTQSLSILDTMHRDYHDHARIHSLIHIQMLLTHAAAGRYLHALVQILILPTAAPGSWAQKYLGLVRKGI